MRPNAKSLITKGLLSLRKAIALATKGLLDEPISTYIKKYIRGQKRIKGYAFDLHYNIIGQKAFSKIFDYYIIGIKLFEVVRQFALKAKKSIRSIFESLIQAKVQNSFALKTSIAGQLGRIINSSLNINGIKSTKHNVELVLAGVSQTSFSQENYVKASKSFSTLYTSTINGTKKIDIKDNIQIKGKRDIKNILFALDLMGD